MGNCSKYIITGQKDDQPHRKVLLTIMKILSLFSIIVLLFMNCIQNALFAGNKEGKLLQKAYLEKSDNASDEIEFSHHATLDRHGSYHLFWRPLENEIIFEVQVKLAMT